MEQELQKTATESQLASMHLNLINELFFVNTLVSYPITDSTLEIWADSLKELEPEITPEVIKWIVDKMKIGFIDFDNRKGIQNIFIGFRKYIDFKINESGSKVPYGVKTKWNVLYKKYNHSENEIF